MGIYARRVAVIGAGPSGLATARYLKSHGFEPTIYEAASRLGGQWNAGGAMSGVWPGMRANASRVVMRFSDLDYPADTETFPKSEDVLAYLDRYAEAFGLVDHLRLNTSVETLARHPTGGWVVHSRTAGSTPSTEIFPRVVIAAGRFNRPAQPEVAGLESFSGAGDVIHSFDYRGVEPYRGKTVLVAGCSISALEIASELAHAGIRVISTMRRQRYVIKRLIGGVPADNLAITRFAALASECLPYEATAAGLKELIVGSSGHPGEHGALQPADDVFEAGIALNDHFLDLVAAGRIAAKPWIKRIEGRTVAFTDGSSAEVDAIIFGTGFKLELPFLDRKTRSAVGLAPGGGSLDLCDLTFHPELQGLAFVGLYDLLAPSFPILELQARWVAYAWAGLAPFPSAETMRARMAEARARAASGMPLMQEVALRFARNAGVEPKIADWPGLARALLFGPLTAVSFRLSGPDALPGIAWDVMTEAARLGAVPTPVLSEEEHSRIAELISAGRAELVPLLSARFMPAKAQRMAA